MAVADARRFDPPVRPSGKCAECGKQREIPKREPYRSEAERDPFCSTDCCRRWYGLAEPPSSTGGKPPGYAPRPRYPSDAA